MAEYSTGSFAGRLREWRGRRAQQRAAARWPTAPEPPPAPTSIPDPQSARWLPEPEHEGVVADSGPAVSAPSRWLTSDAEQAVTAGASTALAPAKAHAADWLPEALHRGEEVRVDGGEAVPPQAGDSSRWVPQTDAREQVEDDGDDDGTERRRAAAEAYCRVVCPETAVAVAVEEALDAAGESDPDLLSATRSAAATKAIPVASPKTWRQRLAAEHEEPCQLTPGRLAERANGTLTRHEQHELDRHLTGCPDCQAAAEREHAATAAFAAVLPAAVVSEERDPAAAGWTGAPVPAATIAAAAPKSVAPEPRRRAATIPFRTGAALLAALIVVGAVVLITSGGGRHAPAVPIRTAATAAATVTKPRAVHQASAAKRSAHRNPARRRRPGHHPVRKAAHHGTTSHTAVTSAPGLATAPAVRTEPPAVTTQPSAPIVTAPPRPTTVTSVGQASLPATTAPQSGVGGSTK